LREFHRNRDFSFFQSLHRRFEETPFIEIVRFRRWALEPDFGNPRSASGVEISKYWEFGSSACSRVDAIPDQGIGNKQASLANQTIFAHRFRARGVPD
jgi:hypothetical protein